MLVKVVGSIVLGVEAISVMVSPGRGAGHRLAGLPEKASKQTGARFFGRLLSAAAEQISLYNVGKDTMVGELSGEGSLQSIKEALPITIQAHKDSFKEFLPPGKLSISHYGVPFLNKLSEFNPMILEFTGELVEVSEVRSASCTTPAVKSFSVIKGPSLSGPYSPRDSSARNTQGEMQSTGPQETYFNSQIYWHLLQEFCKLDGHALKAKKTAAANQEFSGEAYKRILKISRTDVCLSGPTDINIEKRMEAINSRFGQSMTRRLN